MLLRALDSPPLHVAVVTAPLAQYDADVCVGKPGEEVAARLRHVAHMRVVRLVVRMLDDLQSDELTL